MNPLFHSGMWIRASDGGTCLNKYSALGGGGS